MLDVIIYNGTNVCQERGSAGIFGGFEKIHIEMATEFEIR